MKITILGGAGLRTPLIVKTIINRLARVGVDNLTLMDIEGEPLKLMGRLITSLIECKQTKFKIKLTTDSKKALDKADFVITTFRVGNIEHRIIDEKVAMSNHIIGQETTGPGGFAMAMRTIPVIVDYVHQMEKLCPDAWLINFTNPSGLMAEVILKKLEWLKGVGVCDGPASMLDFAAEYLKIPLDQLFLDYFGLNHLGWIRSILNKGKNILPSILEKIVQNPKQFNLPFQSSTIQSLKMIPNEYLYYYYDPKSAFEKALESGLTRGEQLLILNNQFIKDISELIYLNKSSLVEDRYMKYLFTRWKTYMLNEDEKGSKLILKQNPKWDRKLKVQGYSKMAMDIIESILLNRKLILILNILNRGSIEGMENDASVEIPTLVDSNGIHPLVVGKIPDHCLDLMSHVKAYERLTIEAAMGNSYKKALQALTIHPLIHDEDIAKNILDDYIDQHGKLFPKLS